MRNRNDEYEQVGTVWRRKPKTYGTNWKIVIIGGALLVAWTLISEAGGGKGQNNTPASYRTVETPR